MIVAIEGPDCSGKTTLFDGLRKLCVPATYVARNKTSSKTLGCLGPVNDALNHLWWQLYEPGKLYICDRHFVVSNPVYDQLYRREPGPLWRQWWPLVLVVHLDPPLEVLEQHYSIRGDLHFDAVHYPAVKRLYFDHVQNFKHIRVEGEADPAEIAKWIAINA